MPSKLERYLSKSEGDLPAMPIVAEQVVKVIEKPDTSIDDIRKLIEQDAAIAGRILKISNSALYGFPSKIQSLGHAISLLGTMTVRNLVLAASMKQTYKRFGLMEKLLWQHSSIAGPVAATLAKHSTITADPDIAFTAGLLHHVGKTALANSHRDEYEKVMARVYNEQCTFVQAETDQFGFDHTALGAAVAEKWQLPAELVSVIRNHHDHEKFAEMDEETGRLTALIAITSLCLSKLGVGRSRPIEELDIAAQPAWAFLGLSADEVEPVLSMCSERIKESQVLIV